MKFYMDKWWADPHCVFRHMLQPKMSVAYHRLSQWQRATSQADATSTIGSSRRRGSQPQSWTKLWRVCQWLVRGACQACLSGSVRPMWSSVHRPISYISSSFLLAR